MRTVLGYWPRRYWPSPYWWTEILGIALIHLHLRARDNDLTLGGTRRTLHVRPD